MTRAPSLKQVIMFHAAAMAEHGGEEGLRDEGLLDAAISAPFQTWGGQDLFPSLIEKAARLTFGILTNHPFVDGNKRTAEIALLYFLRINSINIEYTQTEIYELIMAVASGNKSHEDIVSWIISHQSEK